MTVPPSLPIQSQRPNRHKMMLISWLGIYPTITLVLMVIGPVLFGRVPLPLLTLVVTLIVVPAMSYVVMPLLTRLLGRWLYHR